MTEEEITQRTAPRTGEVWEFDNGVTATIAEVSDENRGIPEIAYTDDDTVFKYNDMRDPKPVRKL